MAFKDEFTVPLPGHGKVTMIFEFEDVEHAFQPQVEKIQSLMAKILIQRHQQIEAVERGERPPCIPCGDRRLKRQ